MLVRADLHIHSVLSACAEVEMIPPLIVECALDCGLDLIAITDHNAGANAAAVIAAAANTGLRVLPGMEMQTREEVHLLCLFDSLDQLERWQAEVDAALPSLANRPDKFGEQYVVDSSGDYVRSDNRLRQVSADCSLEQAARQVLKHGGMAIPAHIDRPANGLMALLGLVPPGLDVPALEISAMAEETATRERFNISPNVPMVRSSDAHWLNAIGCGVTELDLDGPRTIAALTSALESGRCRVG